MPRTASLADYGRAETLRDAMTDRLIADDWSTSPEVEAAFRAVPRHEFVPQDTILEDA